MYDSNLELKTNLIAFVMCFGMFMWSLSAGLVTIALPTISQYLDVNTSLASWVIVAHLLVITSFLLIFGKIGDHLGYKKVYTAGVFIFIIGSYFSGISLDILQLILSRILQGIGSAMLLAMTPAIISVSFPHGKRGKIFGYVSLATTIALALGYGIGGFLTEYYDYNWIFFLMVPVGILTLIMAYYLPDYEGIKDYHGFDLIGSLLIFFSMVTLIITFEMGGRLGWTSPYIIIGFLSTIVLFLVFYFWELRYPNPLYKVNLLVDKHMNISILSGFLSSFVLTGTIFLLPFYLELVMNYSTYTAGLIILIPTLLIVVVGPLSGKLSDKIGSRLPAIIGAVFLAIALLIFTLLNPILGKYGIAFLVLALILRSLSAGIFPPANNKLVMSHSPKGMLGSVSSLLNTAKYLGLVMGVVIFETVFNSTVSNFSSGVEGLTDSGAFQFSVPPEILLSGFKEAFLIGVIFSILTIVTSVLAKENHEVEEY